MTDPFHSTNRTHDYLERPPMTPSPSDNSFMLSQLKSVLDAIKLELLKDHPDVLCATKVDGGNLISDTLPHTVRFEVGGKPVTVHKTLLWNPTAKIVAASVTGLVTFADGFVIDASPITLSIPIQELSIALVTGATQIAVNMPSNLATDGSIFIYGFTIPDYERM